MKAPVKKNRANQHQAFIDALGDSVLSHSDVNERPLEIELIKPFPFKLRVYLFTCSNPPGGRAPNEYKFNLNVPGQEGRGNFDTSDNCFIILSAILEGANLEDHVFVLWDASMHTDFTKNANVQTKAELIQMAKIEDVSILDKTNGETVIAARGKNLIKAIALRNDLTFKKLFGV